MENTKNLNEMKSEATDLEKMLGNLDKEIASESNALPKNESAIKSLDYEKMLNETKETARMIVESVCLLYIDKEFLSSASYIIQRMDVDKMTITDLLIQMKTSEHAIAKLLEEIDTGDTKPRTFEALSSLQKSKMEIVKHLTSFMITMETNYKNLGNEAKVFSLDEHKDDAAMEEIVSSDNVVNDAKNENKFRGAKELMSSIQMEIKPISKNDIVEDISDENDIDKDDK